LYNHVKPPNLITDIYPGADIVIDSNVTEGDDSAGICEELLNNIVVPGESPQIGTTG
jgi:hypothetical protein